MSLRTISGFFGTINTYLRDSLDIHDDLKLLKECFSVNYLRKYDENSIASYACNLPVMGFREENEKFRKLSIERLSEFMYHTNLNPILFFAYIGQGKTTYLKHLTCIRFPEDQAFIDLRKKIYFLYVAYTDADLECTYILSDAKNKLVLLVNQILTEHEIVESYEMLSEVFPAQKIIYETINEKDKYVPISFKKYIIENSGVEIYYRSIVNWLLLKKRIKICSIVDNIDQHFHFDKSVGREKLIEVLLYLKANYTQLIIPLRHSNKGFQNNPFFKALVPIPVTLGLPDYAELINKRIDYVKKFYVENLSDPIIAIGDNSYLTTEDIFKSIKQICLLIKNNEEVRSSLYLISNYISRVYLRLMINNFSAMPLFRHPFSGEVMDYDKHVKQIRFYSLFIYALMLRNNKFHDENDADILIINVFNNKSDNSWNTFIRYYLLYHLNQRMSKVIHVVDFIKYIQSIYDLDKEEVKNSLKSMILKDCISFTTDDQMEGYDIDELLEKESISISISPRGAYHLRLSKEIEYYEVLAMSNMITDKEGVSFSGRFMKSYRAINLAKYLRMLVKQEEIFKQLLIVGDVDNEYSLLWTKNILSDLTKAYYDIFGDENKIVE
ncbi:MAG: hypothetical protein HGB12_08035 [Bacteroidetes bacterium]|nr:hypothetical protein [Bacteroidota bacterium]